MYVGKVRAITPSPPLNCKTPPPPPPDQLTIYNNFLDALGEHYTFCYYTFIK